MPTKFSPYVVIYAKIGCNQLPTPDWCDEKYEPRRACTGEEIFNYLMSDTKYCPPVMDNGIEVELPGDPIIWVLCCNEKGGQLFVNYWQTEWRGDGASPYNVARFLDQLKKQAIITEDQHRLLMVEVEFAKRHFTLHYDIAHFLAAKHFLGQMTLPHEIVPVPPQQAKPERR